MLGGRWMKAAVAVGLTSVGSMVVAAGVDANEVPGATDRIGDAAFDVADGRGDVTSASMTAAGNGTIFATMSVREYADPLSDPTWVVELSAPGWHIDVDLDGEKDFWGAVWHQNGRLVGGVLDAANRLVCNADAASAPQRARYSVRFDRACIGSPATFAWRAVMGLDVGARLLFDSAPDFGWAGPARDVAVAPIDPNELTTVLPARLLDTRRASVTVDGQARGIGQRAAGVVTRLDVAGRADVPDDAIAATLNVTAVAPDGDGFVTVWSCEGDVPNASSVNFRTGRVASNAVFTKLAPDGSVCLVTSATTDLVVDVGGYVPKDMTPTAVVPERLFDSRVGGGVGGPPAGRLAAGSVVRLGVEGRGGVPAGASAVLLNVTAVLPGGSGFVTVWPCGRPQPLASSVNFGPGDVIPNAVLAKVGEGGQVCFAASAETDLVVDINGFVPTGGSLVPVEPARVLETRSPSAGSTIDGVSANLGRRPAGTVTEVVIAGRAGVPADASSVMLNVTAVQPNGDGFLTVWACDSPRPLASNVNYRGGQVVPNAVVTKLGPGGRVCVYTLSATHIVIDVNGHT
jgi:hypothetical protein